MKIISKDNIRVEVEPGMQGFNYVDEEEKLRDCKEIVEQVKRHVDNVFSCNVFWDPIKTCSFCGYGWDEDEKTGEPFCCTKAVEEWEKEKGD